MKTNYFIMAMLLLLSVTSCSTYYRMSSRIEKDGSIYREIYAQGDSAFLAGDKTHNPFLFQPDANWQLVNLDSTIKFNFWGEEEKLNVKACQKNFGNGRRILHCCQKQRTPKFYGYPHGTAKKEIQMVLYLLYIYRYL